MYWIIFWRIKHPVGRELVACGCLVPEKETYKHRSSTTLMTDRMPRWLSFGVGAPASEPSPRKTELSSDFTLVLVSKMRSRARGGLLRGAKGRQTVEQLLEW